MNKYLNNKALFFLLCIIIFYYGCCRKLTPAEASNKADVFVTKQCLNIHSELREDSFSPSNKELKRMKEVERQTVHVDSIITSSLDPSKWIERKSTMSFEDVVTFIQDRFLASINDKYVADGVYDLENHQIFRRYISNMALLDSLFQSRYSSVEDSLKLLNKSVHTLRDSMNIAHIVIAKMGYLFDPNFVEKGKPLFMPAYVEQHNGTYLFVAYKSSIGGVWGRARPTKFLSLDPYAIVGLEAVRGKYTQLERFYKEAGIPFTQTDEGALEQVSCQELQHARIEMELRKKYNDFTGMPYEQYYKILIMQMVKNEIYGNYTSFLRGDIHFFVEDLIMSYVHHLLGSEENSSVPEPYAYKKMRKIQYIGIENYLKKNDPDLVEHKAFLESLTFKRQGLLSDESFVAILKRHKDHLPELVESVNEALLYAYIKLDEVELGKSIGRISKGASIEAPFSVYQNPVQTNSANATSLFAHRKERSASFIFLLV